MLVVGTHRYILENFTGDTLEGVTVREMDQHFDPVYDEVCCLIKIATVLMCA